MRPCEFSPPLMTLKGSPQILYPLIETLPANERYSYDFEGNSETLDHIVVSPHILNSVPFVDDVVHVNSEFANQAKEGCPVSKALKATPITLTAKLAK